MRSFIMTVTIIFMSMFPLNMANASTSFADVPSTNGAYGEISYLVNAGVIKGYTENGKTLYKPNAHVTRGQAAKMVVVATKNKPLTVQNSSFSDVTVGTELSGYVESAVKLGFFSEQSKGKFAPNTPLTREEMSKVLAIAFNLNTNETGKLEVPFKDINPSYSYYPYVAAIYFNGITVDAEKYNPKNSVTRAQFASFIARASSEKYRLPLPVQGVSVPNISAAIASVKAKVDNLNVRTSSSSANASNILTKVNTGTPFKVFEVQQDGWLKVSYEGRYAYVYKDYVDFTDESGQLINKVQKNVYALNDIQVYQKRDVSSDIVSSLADKEKIAVYGTIGNWYVTLVNGLPGYVRISQTQDTLPVEEVVTPPVVEEKPTVEPPTTVVEEEQNTPEPPAESGVENSQPEKPMTPPQQLLTNTIGKATVDALHIRESALGTSRSLGQIKRGTLVEVHSLSGNWAEITYNGINGYINKTYLQLLNQTGAAVKDRIIVLDPGHGGKDPGAVKKNAREKEIVLKVANLVKQKLEKDGATVKMTRIADTFPSLEERVKYAKNENGEIFISLHANAASKETAKGTETFYSVTSNANEKEDFALATAINNEIVKNAKMYNRGVKRADYVVIKGQVMPAVLVELGFLTNSEDYNKLVSDDYIEIFAQSIYNGIVEYYTK
ncbi:N-acetylmuramoyl-L-alanine amidase [Solibacillus sp. FSL W8-0474]|uniref:N-acetylmuramoyl-L-alanine amidase n=1 Tax=Solibacillus sp. FSL W8-0474 TaxID=2975336 RepID=UPI0030F7D31C